MNAYCKIISTKMCKEHHLFIQSMQIYQWLGVAEYFLQFETNVVQHLAQHSSH